jgi:ElaA protein
MEQPQLHRATAAELDPLILYAVLRLRVAVFVVEQRCAYQELDGRDLDPTTSHYWMSAPGDPAAVLAYLRLLSEPRQRRIGRVCVAPSARERGLAGNLMRAALHDVGDEPCVLAAQTHLAGFYAGFGFQPDGEPYDEDGIPHLPMRRLHGELRP